MDEKITLSNAPKTVVFDLTLSPGGNTFEFECDGEPGVYPARTVVFAVENFDLRVVPASGGK